MISQHSHAAGEIGKKLMSKAAQLPPLFAEAYALPQAQYVTPKQSQVAPEEAMLTRMFSVGMTNATSRIPVIGTKCFSPCTACILYNRNTKTAIVAHDAEIDPEYFERLLQRVRSNDHDLVDVHIMGAPIQAAASGTENLDTIDYLIPLLSVIKETSNATLATFDVYDKPKPHHIAFDTRTGTLIRGSTFCRTAEEVEEVSETIESTHANDLLSDWPWTGGNFDGTAPEYQRPAIRMEKGMPTAVPSTRKR
jgi:hypothetical protein